MFGSPEDHEPEIEDDYDFWERTEDMLDDEEKAMKEMESSWTDGHRGNMPVSDKYKDKDSDIDIISSDGIRFMVHTSILKRVSLVLQSSLPSTIPSHEHHIYEPITLTNNDIGHSVVITRFLDLVYPNLSPECMDGLLYRRVIRLAREWKCLYILDRISKEVSALVHARKVDGPTSVRSLFIIAVGLEDPVVLANIVVKSRYLSCDSAWTGIPYTCEGSVIASPMSLPTYLAFGCWSLEEYQSIPPTVIWTLGIAKKYNTLGREVVDHTIGRAYEAELCFAYHSGDGFSHDKKFDWSEIFGISDENSIHHYHVQHASYAKHADNFDFAAKWTVVDIAQPRLAEPITTDLGSKFDDGRTDLLMVSSDRAKFRVHSLMMARASPVFSSMISLAQTASPSKHLVFFDRELENQSIMDALLDVIYKYELPPLYKTTTILYLIDLADKWDVKLVHRIVKKNLEASFWIAATRNFDLFLIAIKLKEYELAAAFIDRAESAAMQYVPQYPIQAYDRQAPRPRKDHRIHTRLYDINTCNYEDFIQLPPRVAWALQKATLMWDHGSVDDYKLKNCNKERLAARRKYIAQSFRRIMDPRFKPAKMPAPGSRGFAKAPS